MNNVKEILKQSAIFSSLEETDIEKLAALFDKIVSERRIIAAGSQ
jgi:hypothetical protein